MTLIVEDGSGVLKANSYVGLAYAQTYLLDRGRNVTPWSTSNRAQKEAALIAATDYIDKRFALKFLGQPTFQNIAVPGRNLLIVLAIPDEDETVTFNTTTYIFKVAPTLPLEVAIGGSPEQCAFNIMSAASAQVDMNFSVIGSVVEMEASETGDLPYPTTTTSPDLVFETNTLTGGSTSSGQQPLCFPRTVFVGIPEVLKMATVEYATRALTDDLMPDPVLDETGNEIRRRFEKVGPIEEEVVYQSSDGKVYRVYPEADYLLKTLISDHAGVYR
jgi:hypothetical protein